MDELVIRNGLVRALCFHSAWGYAPTEGELLASFDRGKSRGEAPTYFEVARHLREEKMDTPWHRERGRVTLKGEEGLIQEHEYRTLLFPRKLRRARRITRWLVRLAGVRFVALCNTTALAHARDEGDLDFFIVTKQGSLWQTRGLAALPFKLLGRRPQDHADERDAVCLSFFIDDSVLNLSSLQLVPADPYFRHWFLSFLPLWDDGVGEELWRANEEITARHPLSTIWRLHPECTPLAPRVRIPALHSFEGQARLWQTRVLPTSIRSRANTSTHVVVNEHVLKLHVTDNRARYAHEYEARCQKYGVEP